MAGRMKPRSGMGGALRSARSQEMEKRRRELARINASRIACPICGLKILPGAMAAHRGIMHEEE